jgi:GWxTD domain-containing protein
MTQKTLAFILLASALLAAVPAAAESGLSSKHKAWLETEAGFIMAPSEKNAFLKLTSDRERDLFIESFWLQRDPTPGTAANEYQSEQVRRLRFADATFDEENPGGGRMTARGRVYVILGPPLDVRRTGREGRILEVWTYPGGQAGLSAPLFRIRFRQQGRMGDYVIAEPAVEADTAPGTAPAALPALEEILKAPQKAIDESYSARFLETRRPATPGYSLRTMAAAWTARAFKDPGGIFRLHLAAVPERAAVQSLADRYRADWRLTIELAGRDGGEVYRETKDIRIDLFRAEYDAVRAAALQLLDSFPLAPGAGRLSLRLENTSSKEFAVWSTDIDVPAGKSPWLSPLLLSRSASRLPVAPGGASAAFQVGVLRIEPAVEARFAAGDKIVVFFQVHNAPPEVKAAGIVDLALQSGDRTAASLRRSFTAFKDGLNVLEEIPTVGLAPGDYALRALVLDPTGREILSGQCGLTLTAKPGLKAWVLPQPGPPIEDGYYNGALGAQYLRRGDLDMAAQELSLARFKKPAVLEYALGYAEALLARGEFEMARAAVRPFDEKGADRFDLRWFLGRAAQGQGRLPEAIGHFQRALEIGGDAAPVLNALGDCYLKAGDREMAAQAWRRSLAVKPDQSDIKKKVEALKTGGR